MNQCCPECDGSGYIYVPCFTCGTEDDDPQPKDLMVDVDDIDLDWDWTVDHAQ